MLTNALT